VQPRSDAAMLAAYGRVRRQHWPRPRSRWRSWTRWRNGPPRWSSRADADGDADGAIARELTAIDIEGGRIRMARDRPDPADMALAGVLLTVDEHGKACVLRGLIRPDDKAQPAQDDKPAKPRGPHSERLTHVLLAQRTLALRAEPAGQARGGAAGAGAPPDQRGVPRAVRGGRRGAGRAAHAVLAGRSAVRRGVGALAGQAAMPCRRRYPRRAAWP
jgi:hypothetical protein